MNVKCIPSFHVTAGEKRFTFLEQEIVCAWCEDSFFRSAGDGLLDDLAFQDISADSGEIDAEKGLLIGENPLLDEVRAVNVFAESSWPRPRVSATGWILERTVAWISSGFGTFNGDANRSRSRDSRGLS